MIVVKGIIKIARDGDHDEAVYVDDEILAEVLEDKIHNKQVSVNYFIADQPETKAVLIEDLIKKLYGAADAKYNHVYSEYTGYLWTDEEFNIGGHDLIEEIRSNAGKFLYMEIDIQTA